MGTVQQAGTSAGVGGSVNVAVLGNDADADGMLDNTTVTVVTPPAHGTVLGSGAGLLTYTHDGSATTSDSFTYRVSDDQGAVSNVATVTIPVNGVALSPQDCIDQYPGVNPQDCVISLFDGTSLGDTY